MAYLNSKYFPCPVCEEDVPKGAKACPHCGACEKSGWGDTAADGLDLPDEEFDYGKFVEEEFGGGAKPRGVNRVWWITAVVLLVILAGTTLLTWALGG